MHKNNDKMEKERMLDGQPTKMPEINNAPPNSFTAIGAIARQSTGKGLFATFDGSF